MNKAAALAALLLAACGSEAQPAIEIAGAWARPAVAGQRATAAYLTIRNSGGADRLLGVTTPVGKASLHSTNFHDGVMRMRPVERLEIPADSALALRPGATHVMISGLNQPLEVGQGVPLELDFKRSGKLRVTATVQPPGTDGVTK